MNHFKSLKIGNNPLLIVGCTIIAFGVTHFYFRSDASPKIAAIIGHLLLLPVYLFDEISSRFFNVDYSGNPVVVFFVLLLSYSFIALVISKIFEWRRPSNS